MGGEAQRQLRCRGCALPRCRSELCPVRRRDTALGMGPSAVPRARCHTATGTLLEGTLQERACRSAKKGLGLPPLLSTFPPCEGSTQQFWDPTGTHQVVFCYKSLSPLPSSLLRKKLRKQRSEPALVHHHGEVSPRCHQLLQPPWQSAAATSLGDMPPVCCLWAAAPLHDSFSPLALPGLGESLPLPFPVGLCG